MILVTVIVQSLKIFLMASSDGSLGDLARWIKSFLQPSQACFLASFEPDKASESHKHRSCRDRDSVNPSVVGGRLSSSLEDLCAQPDLFSHLVHLSAAWRQRPIRLHIDEILVE